MTADELIANIQALKDGGMPGTVIVKTYNGDAGQIVPVTGFLYDGQELEFCTDIDWEIV